LPKILSPKHGQNYTAIGIVNMNNLFKEDLPQTIFLSIGVSLQFWLHWQMAETLSGVEAQVENGGHESFVQGSLDPENKKLKKVISVPLW